jgi:hypothetical protein
VGYCFETNGLLVGGERGEWNVLVFLFFPLEMADTFELIGEELEVVDRLGYPFEALKQMQLLKDAEHP